MNKQYKVGEFVKNLGVSVGFLKHHERYGTLTPHISSSGYRYYEFNQAMQAMQCLRLQNLGFTSKEIASILTHSSELDILPLIIEKKEMLQKKQVFHQEILNYIEDHIQPLQGKYSSDTAAESWSVLAPEPFYYIENASERQFIEDPALQTIASSWSEYVPVTDIVSKVRINISDDPSDTLQQITAWNMGLAIRKSAAERLSVPHLEQAALITPGKCLVYHFTGNRPVKKGYDHLKEMLQRPIELCSKHHFNICGDIFEFNTFCSTHGSTTYVREVILIPIAD